jgi:hypothetical protein
MFSVSLPLSSVCKIRNLLTSVALDKATYNCQWVKDEVRKSIPTMSSDCPCALFTVIAKHNLTGNCFQVKMKGNSPSVVESLMFLLFARLAKKHVFVSSPLVFSANCQIMFLLVVAEIHTKQSLNDLKREPRRFLSYSAMALSCLHWEHLAVDMIVRYGCFLLR